MNLLQRPSSRTLYITLTAPAIGYVAFQLLSKLMKAANSNGIPAPPKIYRAPSRRMLTPSKEETIPYPPDALPGGRDIDTPYGNLRAYESGPETGRKILFVHGISTPCIALAKMAKLLVRKGHRVILWDLPGRGYSDCPDPELYRQDIQLFSAQMLAVLASSNLNWMGPDGFTLVGYSLGGGIAAAFASHYPEFVSSLVLIAPGGLLRPTRLNWSSRLLYSGMLPHDVVHHFVGKRLRVGGAGSKPMAKTLRDPSKKKIDITNATAEELPDEFDPHAPGQDSISPIFDDRPYISPATAVQWQLDVHPGFIPAFVSSIKYAPIHDGWTRWRLIGERCEASKTSKTSNARRDSATYLVEQRGLREGKVLLVLGTRDVIIMPEETTEDATSALGKDNVHIVKVQGGHDMPLTHHVEVVDAMSKFWEGSER